MSEPTADCVVGLGANLDDRRATLAWAVRQCAGLGQLLGVSALYETRPVGGPPQPDFLNAAVRIATGLDPVGLWNRLLQIERQAGRQRQERWGPRTLDLDILWIRGMRLSLPSLTIPHPRLMGRAFALVPLLDVAPDARDPVSGQRYRSVARRLDARGIRVAKSAGEWVVVDA
jgi:2-amino-4-hydroxy-6-hydroxymethyldihydropteridine diphosphokinase